jgi:uncharacterized protein (DUF58 family)
MRPTRRWWALAGTAVVLLGVALLGERLLPLVGAVSLGAFCLVAAARAASTFAATHGGLAVGVRALPARAVAGGDTTLSIELSLDRPATHSVVLDCGFPVGVSGESITLAVDAGESSAREFVAATFPVAGQFDLPDLEYTFISRDGLFTQRVPVDDDERVTVTVEAYGTGDIHIGTGGTAVSTAFGGHRSEDHASRGDDLSSIREYTTSDPASRIDWNATARLDDPHVREYEASHEQDTRLVVDGRGRLTDSEAGRRKIDFLREVGLSVLGSAERADDPLALTVIDDEGVRTATRFAGTTDHYRRIRGELLDLGAETSPAPAVASPPERVTTTDEAWTTFARLRTRPDGDTAFTATLRPFFRRTDSYVERAADDPLVVAVRRHAREGSLGTLTVVLTDDADRGRLREAMKLATRNDGLATAFVAPDVLFEAGGIDDLESAYRRFAEFEEFRRTLERLPRVSAYEVGPDDRLRALFARRPGRSRSRDKPDSRS